MKRDLYAENWIGLLKADTRAFFTACSKAQAAADYLRGLALAEPTEAARNNASDRRHPLFDIHPVTGASIEVFFADGLATFGRGGAGWFWRSHRYQHSLMVATGFAGYAYHRNVLDQQLAVMCRSELMSLRPLVRSCRGQ